MENVHNIFPHRFPSIDKKKTALLIIDVQNGTFNEKEENKRPEFYRQASEKTIPNIHRLLHVCRKVGMEVIYTVIESLTLDGRDRSLDYKLSDFHFPKGCWESQVIPSLSPGADEIILPKTSSSLFNSTIFDYVLKNIGIQQVIVTGFLTDQCVDHTIRDGADRGYLMICAADGCATESRERHEHALAAFGGYCRVAMVEELISEIGVR